MFKWFKKFFEKVPVERPSCPDCGESDFWKGPEGGMSTNICCMNPNCGQAFNICYGFDFYDGCDSSKWERINNRYFEGSLEKRRDLLESESQ